LPSLKGPCIEYTADSDRVVMVSCEKTGYKTSYLGLKITGWTKTASLRRWNEDTTIIPYDPDCEILTHTGAGEHSAVT